MPPLPRQGAFTIGSAGGTVLVGGVACADGTEFAEGQTAIFQIRDGSKNWEQIYADAETIDIEAKVLVTAGNAGTALFSIGQIGVLVGEDGVISDDLPMPREDIRYGYSYFCHFGDRVVMVPASGDPGAENADGSVQTGVQITRAAGSVWELRFDALADGYQKVADAPRDINNIGAITECAGTQLVIHNDEIKWTYDTSTRGWTTGPSSYRELTGSQVFGPAQPGEIAVSPNGEKVYAVTSGGLIERTREGNWGIAGVTASEVYATAGNVLAITLPAGAQVTFTDLTR